MSKRFWILTILLVVGFISFVGLRSHQATDAAATSTATAPTHRIGKQGATVTLVEYSDFQCSACGAYYPIVEQIIQKYQDRISFEYRHYPLITIHRNAFAAARASEAAGDQGKFWEMYRLLFDNQGSWANSKAAQTTFESYAQQLHLNIARYKTDFASSQTNDAITASIAEFNARNLPKSTPTFLLNGKRIEAANTVEAFSTLIDEQLARTAADSH